MGQRKTLTMQSKHLRGLAEMLTSAIVVDADANTIPDWMRASVMESNADRFILLSEDTAIHIADILKLAADDAEEYE